MSKKSNNAIITLSVTKAGFVPVQKLFRIIKSISNEVYIITGGLGADLKDECHENCHIYTIEHQHKRSTFSRVLNFIRTQFKYLIQLNKIIKDLDQVIFHIGGQGLILPILLARIHGKKVVIVFAGSPASTARAKKDSLTGSISLLSQMACRFSSQIIVNSMGQIKEFNLEKYSHKIETAFEHIIDFNRFHIERKFDKREENVGYVGRLSQEKGILNYLEAVHILTQKGMKINFTICGEGDLEEEVKEYIKKWNLQDKVEFKGWIPYQDLPDHLNNLKLIVIPSYTEGLPNLMLEAMTCGTPVLANPVGSIPEIISNGKNGFLLDDNSPENIAHHIIRSLDSTDLNSISDKAHEYIVNNFSLEDLREHWAEILYK
ncbi:MAG: glycosyltransferase family 4 protein [Methanobacteriaceae archaeon]|nr:glycosyltransferase family 4 protein [Methanobacteriaceae archaeon]